MSEVMILIIKYIYFQAYCKTDNQRNVGCDDDIWIRYCDKSSPEFFGH